jgi:hypothetical protein
MFLDFDDIFVPFFDFEGCDIFMENRTFGEWGLNAAPLPTGEHVGLAAPVGSGVSGVTGDELGGRDGGSLVGIVG